MIIPRPLWCLIHPLVDPALGPLIVPSQDLAANSTTTSRSSGSKWKCFTHSMRTTTTDTIQDAIMILDGKRQLEDSVEAQVQVYKHSRSDDVPNHSLEADTTYRHELVVLELPWAWKLTFSSCFVPVGALGNSHYSFLI